GIEFAAIDRVTAVSQPVEELIRVATHHRHGHATVLPAAAAAEVGRIGVRIVRVDVAVAAEALLLAARIAAAAHAGEAFTVLAFALAAAATALGRGRRGDQQGRP